MVFALDVFVYMSFKAVDVFFSIDCVNSPIIIINNCISDSSSQTTLLLEWRHCFNKTDDPIQFERCINEKQLFVQERGLSWSEKITADGK